MFRLRFLSPFKSNNNLLFKKTFRFSSENKPTENKIHENTTPQEPINSKTQSEAPQKPSATPNPYQQDAANSFLKRLEKMEQSSGSRGRGGRKIDGILFPALLCLTSAFLYHCWLNLPYNTVYKHATINEYINQKGYYHAIFLSSLSFQNMGHLVLYYPMMIYSLVLLSKYLKQRHIALIFITNSLITTAATYYFEKYNKRISNLMIPKVNGSVTPLCFMSCFLMIKPDHFIMNNRFLPFFILPAIYYMNEWNEYQIGQINEISRPAHFTAIGYGLLCGLILKILITKGKL